MLDQLTSKKSDYSFKGTVYRAANSTNKASALGKGLYFTPDESAAKNYGSEVYAYVVKLNKVLGTNSSEYDSIRNAAQKRKEWIFDNHPGEAIAKEAQSRKYDAIYAGGVYGLVIFKPKGKVKIL